MKRRPTEPALRSQRSKVAWALARERADGWKAHQFMDRPPSPGTLTPEEWADCNWRAFVKQAAALLKS